MDTFSTIRFKIKIANKFRKFSAQIARTHSEALESMLNFFDWNDLSPNDNLGVKNDGTKKRINALIAIVKNIEKHQTKPTNAMINLLFKEAGEDEEEEQVLLEEVLSDGISKEQFTEHTELEYYRNQYFGTKSKFNDLKNDYEMVLKKTKYIRSNFGIGHFRLEITKEEFENLKNKLEHVHHNNSPKTNG